MSSLPANSELQSNKAGCWRPPARLLVLVLTIAGFMVQMALQVAFSVAIVAMVNHTAIPRIDVSTPENCALQAAGTAANTSEVLGVVYLDGNVTPSAVPQAEYQEGDREAEEVYIESLDGEFAWDEVVQGTLLSAFYWGYFLTQVLGGFLAERFGSKVVIGVSQSVNGLLSLLLPTAADYGEVWVAVVRAAQGAVCGTMYPSLPPLIARWYPPGERELAFGVVNAFACLGVTASSALAAIVAVAMGWRAVFYFAGAVALFWAVFWFSFMHDTPDRHPLATESEKNLIGTGNVTRARTRRRPPYLAMLCSPPVLAIVAAEVANGWALICLMTLLPTYKKHVLGFELEANGALSGLPMLGRASTLALLGWGADVALKRRWLSLTTIRRSSAAMFGVGCASLLLLVTLVGCHPTAATVFFVLAGVFNGFVGTGHLLNTLDIAPNYSGSVTGIANFIGSGVSTLNPLVTGALIRGEQTAERWNYVFYLGAGVSILCLILYQVMMSTERQPWDEQDDDDVTEKGEDNAAMEISHHC